MTATLLYAAFGQQPDAAAQRAIVRLTHWANVDCKNEVCSSLAKQYIGEVRAFANRVDAFAKHKTKAEQEILLTDGEALAQKIDALATIYKLPIPPVQDARIDDKKITIIRK